MRYAWSGCETNVIKLFKMEKSQRMSTSQLQKDGGIDDPMLPDNTSLLDGVYMNGYWYTFIPMTIMKR